MASRVLIVEDEPHILEILSFILDVEGFEVVSAADGELAMLALQRERPDVVVLDLMLPRKNGFEVLKQIKGDPDLKSIPIVVLTAKGQAQDRRLAEEMGVDTFMTKPFANSEVIEAIRRLTDR
jgi:DNA-binding response OmpR family regulator